MRNASADSDTYRDSALDSSAGDLALASPNHGGVEGVEMRLVVLLSAVGLLLAACGNHAPDPVKLRADLRAEYERRQGATTTAIPSTAPSSGPASVQKCGTISVPASWVFAGTNWPASTNVYLALYGATTGSPLQAQFVAPVRPDGRFRIEIAPPQAGLHLLVFSLVPGPSTAPSEGSHPGECQTFNAS